MFSRALRVARTTTRAQSSATGIFNKYNFNLLPPPTHAYWNIRNSSLYVVYVPLFLAVTFLGKFLGSSMTPYDSLLEFADDEKSPIKELKFGEPQLRK